MNCYVTCAMTGYKLEVCIIPSSDSVNLPEQLTELRKSLLSRVPIYYKRVYSSPPLSMAYTLQNSQWMLETADSSEFYIYYVFFLYIHTYDKV